MDSLFKRYSVEEYDSLIKQVRRQASNARADALLALWSRPWKLAARFVNAMHQARPFPRKNDQVHLCKEH
jgi:hypothetical protein